MRILTYGLSQDKLAGIETFLLNMNNHMSNEMIFDYIIEGNHCVHEKSIINKGGEIIYIHHKKKMILNIIGWYKLLKNRKDINSAVYFNLYSMSWIIPVVLSRFFRYPVIVHSHNNDLHRCGILLKILHYLNRRLQRHFKLKRLTNSDLSSNFMFGKSNDATLIFNAIDIERFSFNENVRNKIRERHNLLNKNVYGFSGRLSYQKNPIFLLEIFKKIRDFDKSSVLMIAGEGELKNEIQTFVKKNDLIDHVLLLGNVIKIENYYQAMDFYILPSRFEGLGIVLIEAQTAGLNCLSSSMVVPKEAKVTELLNFLSLSEGPEVWAKCAFSNLTRNEARIKYSQIVKNTRFNIQYEALNLEKIIKDYVLS